MASKQRNIWKAFRESVARAIQELYPGAGYYDRVVYARVVSVNSNPGMVTDCMKLWSIDAEILTPSMEPDPAIPVVKGIPIDPIEISEIGQAMFPVPFPGLIVRVGWMYGHRGHPFIHSFTSERQLVPGSDRGSLSSLLFDAVRLLSMPRATAVGPGPYDGQTQADLLLLLSRIPHQ